MKKLLFIFNPNAGKGKIQNVLVDIIKLFSEGGYITTTYPTKASKDAYEFALKHESD